MSSTMDMDFPELIAVREHLYKEVLLLLKFGGDKIKLAVQLNFIRCLSDAII